LRYAYAGRATSGVVVAELQQDDRSSVVPAESGHDGIYDADGYRFNVGIVLLNRRDQVFWGRRIGQDAWQFPQGGMQPGETPVESMYRELHEEVGLLSGQVEIVAESQRWLRYTLPGALSRAGRRRLCVGQRQRWFLLRLDAPDHSVNLRATGHPEFDAWRWVDFWLPPREVIFFKRRVYRRALEEFAAVLRPVRPEAPPRGTTTRARGLLKTGAAALVVGGGVSPGP